MNKWIGMGRLCADPEIRYTQGAQPMCIARYRLAVNRPKDKNGEQKADYINCVAFGARGEFASKWLKKGTMIAICGHIQTGSYDDKDGRKVYTTDIIVDEHYFCGSGNGQSNATQAGGNEFQQTNEAAPGQWTNPSYSGQQQGMNDGFEMDDSDFSDDLPFN